jgi:hypothetical protein
MNLVRCLEQGLRIGRQSDHFYGCSLSRRVLESSFAPCNSPHINPRTYIVGLQKAVIPSTNAGYGSVGFTGQSKSSHELRCSLGKHQHADACRDAGRRHAERLPNLVSKCEPRSRGRNELAYLDHPIGILLDGIQRAHWASDCSDNTMLVVNCSEVA